MAEVSRIAVVGASGFIGNRAVEMWHLGGRYQVVPVVRRPSALALASRFDLEPAVADASDRAALERAFAGCDLVLVAVAGDPATIVDTIEPVYRAADRAGVRRLLYLSSASVHGQAPEPGTDERSPIPGPHPLPYNRAKARAEQRLLAERATGRTEVVILRPGIVHGPRSSWTGGLADQLLTQQAFLADGGTGICNSIYVDNVVHALALAADAEGVDGEAFLIGDEETVTWRSVVAPVATALGVAVGDLPTPSSAAILNRRDPLVRRLVPPLRSVYLKLPQPLAIPARIAVRVAREARPRPSTTAPVQSFSRELALLHSCQVRLPHAKAETHLGYRPIVSFDEANRRSTAWLKFAGYPVR